MNMTHFPSKLEKIFQDVSVRPTKNRPSSLARSRVRSKQSTERTKWHYDLLIILSLTPLDGH